MLNMIEIINEIKKIGNIAQLSKKTGLSRQVLHSVRNGKTCSVKTYERLNKFFEEEYPKLKKRQVTII